MAFSLHTNATVPPVTPGNTWSIIENTPEYLDKLRSLVHDTETLQADGYIMTPLTPEEVNMKKRCSDCGLRLVKKARKATAKTVCYNCKGKGHFDEDCEQPPVSEEQLEKNREDIRKENKKQKAEKSSLLTDVAKSELPADIPEQADGLSADFARIVEIAESSSKDPIPADMTLDDPTSREDSKGKKTEVAPKEKKPVCQYHPGKVSNRIFTCCSRPLPSEGCISSTAHTPGFSPPGQLEADWLFQPTPAHLPTPPQPPPRTQTRAHRAFLSTTTPHPPHPAIALDCEMGVAQSGETELIRLTAIDFFTGAPLIDSLVVPDVPMAHYNTRFSGVTARDIRDASRSGRCLRGRKAARAALWRFVGPETVVVLHGGRNDLACLRWIHGAVVDSFLLARGEEAGGKEGRSLKGLCRGVLGREVQGGRGGHCSLEDALGCRELVHWRVCRLLGGDGVQGGV